MALVVQDFLMGTLGETRDREAWDPGGAERSVAQRGSFALVARSLSRRYANTVAPLFPWVAMGAVVPLVLRPPREAKHTPLS